MMFGISGIKLAIYGILGSAAITAVGLGYWHYTSVINERDQLKVNNAVLEQAVELQDSTITAQQEAIAEWEASQARLLQTMEALAEQNQLASTELRRLQDVFSRHDLNALALRRPGLIERRIDLGTARINRMLECATGSPGEDCPN